MKDNRFDFDRKSATLPSGRIVFRARNDGKLHHQVTLIALPDGFPGTLRQELEKPGRRAVPTLVQMPEKPPGAVGVFAVDLPRGRYGLLCSVMFPDGVSHSRRGMVWEFRTV